MAEETKENEERVKLFVGQVPKLMTESQLLALFKEFSIVDEVNIIKDKITRACRGCCFVICPSKEEADKLVNTFHNKKTLSGASSPLQVKYADGELERLEHKLFVGMLPKNVSEADVLSLFSKYGTIKDLQILRGSQLTIKGCVFLKYESKEQAVAAMEAINGKHIMETPATYGYMLPPIQTQEQPSSESIPPRLAAARRNLPMAALGSYMSTTAAYHHPLQYPMAYTRGMITPRLPLTTSVSPAAVNSGATTTPSGVQTKGPSGANLFIYNIPREFGDQELAAAFQPFGSVLSAKVFVDKATGVSKCFGFISYDSQEAAQNAINAMNGRQLSGKKLKVQLKRDNTQQQQQQKQNKSLLNS